MRNVKAQIYGVSTFIYTIAIAIVLIIGMIGLSKDIEAASQAGFYRFSALSAVKNAELLKKLMDEERQYAVDKALFITGAFGGYSTKDLVPIKNCTICKNTCPQDTSCIDDPSNPNYGYCVDADGNTVEPEDCYPKFQACGKLDVEISFLGEKQLPNWKRYGNKCIPTEEQVFETFRDYIDTMFSSPDERVINSIAAATLQPVFFNYYLDFNYTKDVSEDVIQTRWYPIGQIINMIKYPPKNPVVEYEFSPYVHLYTKTPFKKLYSESKNIVENNEFNWLLNDPKNSPIPTVIDVDFSIKKHYKDGTEVTYNSTTPSYGEALLNYIDSNETLYPTNRPNYCSGYQKGSNLLDDCTVHVINSNGKLIIKDFSSNCNSNTKYILCKIVNGINKQLMTKPIKKNVASFDEAADIYSSYCTVWRKNHAIDGETEVNYPYGFSLIPVGCPTTIKLKKPYEISSLKIYLYDGYNYKYKIYASPNCVNWTTIIDATDDWHTGVEEWNITPTKVLCFNITPTASTENYNRMYVVEFQAFSTIDYRYELLEFDLTFEGGRKTDSIVYNATDIQSGGDAPPDVANPDPRDCQDGVCQDETYCSNFPGDPCPCCGSDDTGDFGGHGLICCDADYADAQLKDTCIDPGEDGTLCHGYISLSLNATSVYEGDWIKATITGFCNGCEGKHSGVYHEDTILCAATIQNNGKGECVFQVNDEFSISSGSKTFTITAYSPAVEGGSSSKTITVTACGDNNEPACNNDWKSNMYNGCYDGNVRSGDYCYACGGENQPCCDNENACNSGLTCEDGKCVKSYVQVSLTFPLYTAFKGSGWDDYCALTPESIYWLNDFCKCKGYSGLADADTNPCYYESVNNRWKQQDMCALFNTPKDEKGSGIALIKVNCSGNIVVLPFPLYAWNPSGWINCIPQSPPVDWLDEYCKCKGYSGLADTNVCYYYSTSDRWKLGYCNLADTSSFGSPAPNQWAVTKIVCDVVDKNGNFIGYSGDVSPSSFDINTSTTKSGWTNCEGVFGDNALQKLKIFCKCKGYDIDLSQTTTKHCYVKKSNNARPWDFADMCEWFETKGESMGAGTALIKIACNGGLVELPFPVYVSDTGWRDCSTQSASIYSLNEFCKCKGYSGLSNTNSCYYDYANHRWTYDLCKWIETPGEYKGAGTALTKVKCKP
ncbi:MAG: hypothetical protein J7K22_04705 [Nanoarchaeota archaeon]|nr:hypothetical protein [Nanoarchaeota archaeon]